MAAEWNSKKFDFAKVWSHDFLSRNPVRSYRANRQYVLLLKFTVFREDVKNTWFV
jgi:hypothetical protein